MNAELEKQLDQVYMSKQSINAYLYSKDDTSRYLKNIQNEYLWTDIMDI